MLGLGNIITPSASLAKTRSIRFDPTNDGTPLYLTKTLWTPTNVFDIGGTHDWTLSMWAKLDDANEDVAGGTFNRHQGLLNINQAGGCEADIMVIEKVSDTTSAILFNYTLASGTTSYESLPVLHSILENWFHLAFTMDRSGDFSIYVNGILILANDGLDALDGINLIGGDDEESILGQAAYSGAVYSMKGHIGHIAFWKDLLTLTEIKGIYNNGRPFDLRYNYGNYTSASDLEDYYTTLSYTEDYLPHYSSSTEYKMYNLARPYPDANANYWIGSDGDSILEAAETLPLNDAVIEDVTVDGEHAVKVARGTSDLSAFILHNAANYNFGSVPASYWYVTAEVKAADSGSGDVTLSTLGVGNSVTVTLASGSAWKRVGWQTPASNQSANSNGFGLAGIGIPSALGSIYIRELRVQQMPIAKWNAINYGPTSALTHANEFRLESPDMNLG